MKYLSRDRISYQKLRSQEKFSPFSPKFFLLIPVLEKSTQNYFSVTQVTHLNFHTHTQTHLYIHLVIMFCCFSLLIILALSLPSPPPSAPTLVQAFIIYHLSYCLNSELNFVTSSLQFYLPSLDFICTPSYIAVSKHILLI